MSYNHRMHVTLTADLEKLVNAKVKSGLYPTASEVVREGLRLLEERDRLYQARLLDLRREVRKGLDQLDRGEGRPLDVSTRSAFGRGRSARSNGRPSERHPADKVIE